MKLLTSLNPKFTGILRPNGGEGIEFECPACGPKHHLVAYFSNPLDGQAPAPWQKPTWEREGNTFDVMTITPSIQYPCWHGWIESGKVIGIQESPLTIVALVDGKPSPVALSPMQAVALASSILSQLSSPAAPEPIDSTGGDAARKE